MPKSKIMIVDDSYEIDNIMVKGFDKEIDAKNYFLSSMNMGLFGKQV